MSSLEWRREQPRWPVEPRICRFCRIIRAVALVVAIYTCAALLGMLLAHLAESDPQGSPLVSYFGAPATSLSPKSGPERR